MFATARCCVLQVVPNTKSRAALGELSDRGLHDIFCSEFGAVGSPTLESARENFIVSEAAYAIASYLLQVCLGVPAAERFKWAVPTGS
jgi:phosphatidylinositol 4-kinase